MTAIYLLIPLSLLFLGLAIVAFLWAGRARQFDDLDSPGLSILLDEDRAPTKTSTEHAKLPDLTAQTVVAPKPATADTDAKAAT